MASKEKEGYKTIMLTEQDIPGAELLAREMLTVEQYKCKNRSRKSGQAWDLIPANLNSVHAPHFQLSQKSIRDRVRILLKNFKLNIREE